MRIKDLEILAHGLFFLNNKEVTGDMGDKIAEALSQGNWGDARAGKSYVYLLQTLAKMGTIHIQVQFPIIILFPVIIIPSTYRASTQSSPAPTSVGWRGWTLFRVFPKLLSFCLI